MDEPLQRMVKEMNGACVGKLGLPSSLLERAMAHAMTRMGRGLHGDTRLDAP